MNGLGDAADIATIGTGTAAVAWVRAQWNGWQGQRHERQRRNWHGFIDVGGINTVPVRLAEPPQTGGAIVTIEVLDKRIMIGNEGSVSRPPTVAELDFLKYLRTRDGYDHRNLLVR